MSKLIPFSLFINRYFDKHGLWKLPPILDVVTPALFKEELEVKEGTKTEVNPATVKG